jgi:flagellin
MSISTVSNVGSMTAQRQLNNSQAENSKSLQRLTSGMRINSAMDDAAGLGISEGMRSQMRGLAQASRNAGDGLSVVQTAEGSMGEISNALIRMRELSVQSATDTVSDTQRAFIDTEFQELTGEIDRIANTTTFNGKNLTDGTYAATGLDFQVGHNNGANFRIAVKIADVRTSGLGFGGTEAVDTKVNAQSAMDSIDSALDALSSARSSLGAKGNRLVQAASAVDVQRENTAAANSRIRDTDIAQESSNLTRSQVLVQAGTAMLAQANAAPQAALQLLG